MTSVFGGKPPPPPKAEATPIEAPTRGDPSIEKKKRKQLRLEQRARGRSATLLAGGGRGVQGGGATQVKSLLGQ